MTTAAGRTRRLANLRETLERGAGGPVVPPARAPFAGRSDGLLAGRLAGAIGATATPGPDGWLVRREPPPDEIPIDRARLARLPGHPPPDAPLVLLDTETTGLATAAGTLAFLVGLARWEGSTLRQAQLLLPDHADEPALLAELERWITPDAWLVTYNGRGFDWPLLEARYRLAGRAAPLHADHLDLLPFVRRVFRHRMEDARLRTVERRLLGEVRVGDVEGWEIPAIYLDCLRGGPVDALAGVVLHNERDVRSLARLLALVERGYAGRPERAAAPRGDLAGLARAYAGQRLNDDALACLDDALGAPVPGRDPFGRSPLPAADPDGTVRDGPGAWWAPRTMPTFGGRPPAGGRGGSLGPGAGASAWDATGPWSDERISAERARVLRRLGRWDEAAQAWEVAAAAGGPLGVIAWIETARIRERRLGDPAGALAATERAAALLDRLRRTGRPYPRIEQDVARRRARLAARVAAAPRTRRRRRPADA